MRMSLENSVKLDLYRAMVRIRTFENGIRTLINEGKVSRVSRTVAPPHA